MKTTGLRLHALELLVLHDDYKVLRSRASCYKMTCSLAKPSEHVLLSVGSDNGATPKRRLYLVVHCDMKAFDSWACLLLFRHARVVVGLQEVGAYG